MALQRIKKALRKFLFGFDISTFHFAQHGEDAILYGLFHLKLKHQNPGFYVDIGAFHPYKYSNTYGFYINGWKGINIDACPGSMDSFKKMRPRDINLEVGISDKKGSMTYYFVDKNSPVNSFSKENLEQIDEYRNVTQEIDVQVTTLEEVLDKHADQFESIDFLSIDAEGLDHQVLLSNNWDKYKPSVIVIELNCQDIDDVKENETTKYLYGLGYKVVAKNVLEKNIASVFFVSNSFEY